MMSFFVASNKIKKHNQNTPSMKAQNPEVSQTVSGALSFELRAIANSLKSE
jgi:hypothetical protein